MDHPLFNEPRLTAHHQILAAIQRPAGELRRSRPASSRLPIGRSRIGGIPDVDARFEWPRWSGKALAFLCQLNTNEINAALGAEYATKDRLLLFFYSIEAFWELKSMEPSRHKLLILDTARTALRTPAVVESDTTFLVEEIDIAPTTCFPKTSLDVVESFRFDDATMDAYEEGWEQDNQRRLLAGGGRTHKVFGYADSVHYDPESAWGEFARSDEGRRLAVPPIDAWRLLLQLDYLTNDTSPDFNQGDEFGWGDLGKLFIGVPRACWKGDYLDVDAIEFTLADLHR